MIYCLWKDSLWYLWPGHVAKEGEGWHTKSRIWTRQCAVITLIMDMDTPCRMFWQVKHLADNLHSASYPWFTRAERNPVSWLRLWLNQRKRADATSHGETSFMIQKENVADSAPPHQCYSISTQQKINYARFSVSVHLNSNYWLFFHWNATRLHHDVHTRQRECFSVCTHEHREPFGWL